MYFFHSELNKLIDHIDRKMIASIVLYGSNEGYFSVIIDRIITKCNMSYRRISTNNLKEISYLTKNGDLFSNKTLLRIDDIKPLNQGFQKLLQSLEDRDNFLCFILHEQKFLSNDYKLFTNSPKLASINCCYSNELELKKYIISYMKKVNIILDQAVIRILIDLLKNNDHQYIKNFLLQLTYYTHDKQKISIHDIKIFSSIVTGNISHYSEIFFLIEQQDIKGFLKLINVAQQNNVSIIYIIRILVKCYTNLYYIISHVSSGMSIYSAIQSLQSKSFIKRSEHLDNIIKKSSLLRVVKILTILMEAEAFIKKHNLQKFYIFTNIYLKINSLNY
ncbi:DNA polymerase III subunit delta [Rickettsia endosymbiont of Cardiosporidium cionae]|uniref:DNA polymerase III subunit delta n=1 Tax=Rickettsia endosymbiont of Cardiosporidium cionae TaxID=2777155 RepID=UPI001894B340|nr:hypothetical protein [Rickettsia endosymbiont of Cardiosporidium cionae]KAF8818990.1 DNA polymerase III subunit delta [Rickettsia endosymbiont of Cardiosporidium cionae]